MSDAQVNHAKRVFFEQEITYKQLIAVGEFAVTDETLKEDGIKKRGLRLAILSTIKSILGQ
ncbi:hypothetical protein BJ741DRAFT_595825, partial [Chytriomyces cf. hyalinus JEL632]